jgi:hypothetical protein
MLPQEAATWFRREVDRFVPSRVTPGRAVIQHIDMLAPIERVWTAVAAAIRVA